MKAVSTYHLIRVASRLLKWFCKPYYAEVIEGDLMELYARHRKVHMKGAEWRFFWNVLRFLRWRYLKGPEDFHTKSSYPMYRNYFKVTIRNLLKYKGFSFLNILGLAAGIGACLLIIVHIQNQIVYDQFNPEASKVYRAVNQWGNGQDRYGPYTPARLVSTLQHDYPEVIGGTRVSGPFESIIRLNGNFVTFKNVITADSTFFNLFPNTFLTGDNRRVLTRPGELILTESLATTHFPESNPIGQILEDQNQEKYEIIAVVADPPKNTTVPYQAIMSLPHEEWVTGGWWTGNNFFSYIKLAPMADIRALEAKMPDFIKRYVADEMMEYIAGYDTWEDYLADGNYKSFRYVPLLDIHLYHPRLDLGTPGSITNVITFSVIAFFILMIACINYINMSTAKSSLRAKEVGLRKVMGSARKAIIQQFLTESMLLTIISLIIGIALTMLALPYFNVLTNTAYDLSTLLQLQNLIWILSIALIVGLLAGSYPALYLSRFKPIIALRGESPKASSSKLRMGLVVFQFAISTFLIAVTIIVFTQISYMNNRELGMNAGQIFVLKHATRLGENYEAFRNEALTYASIQGAGLMNSYPSGQVADWGYRSIGEDAVALSPDHFIADHYVQKTLGLELVEGTLFSGVASDSGHVVINETFVKRMGWKDGGTGKILSRGGDVTYRVLGVVKDIVVRSGRSSVRPLLFRYSDRIQHGDWYSGYLHVKIAGNYEEALGHLERNWDKFVPGFPFDGIFLDDSFQRLYESEKRFGQLFTTFSGLAILIALIGLFALAAFSLEKRMREIAVRKVLGATVSGLIRMIIWDFIKLVLIGAILSGPAIWYLGDDWLSNFQYRVTIDYSMVLIPVLVVTSVALLTVVFKSYRTATDNPVNALKQE